MQCPKCQHENRMGAKFCRQCGSALPRICPQCRHRNEVDAQFCDECGAQLVEATSVPTEVTIPKLSDMQSRLYIPEPLKQRMDSAGREIEGENRLVTALFADISGFTPMSQHLTPEATVEKVGQCFQVITDAVWRYEGSINRFMGDCVLAFFGAPLAHENDPERSILAALDMQKEVTKLGLNITVGINSGMVYFGPIGTQQHLEISAYGHDVNLAKRLQEKANPGQILTGAGTYRLTRKAFNFKSLGAVTLKGIRTPVPVYEVLSVKEHPEKLRGIEGLRARMIGREREFAELKDATDQWLLGQGQMVSIIGEAGIGKSRLVSELKTYLQTSEVSKTSEVCEGRCVSIGQQISYWPFLDILRTYLGLSEEDNVATIAHKVTSATTHLFPQSASEVMPFLGHLLSIRFESELDERLKFAMPEQVRYQTLMRLRDFFDTLARKQPLLLILDDLHWADDLSMELLSLLMDSLATNPLMLLCVYRPEREHRVWQLSSQAQRKCLDRYTEITLKPLSSLQSRQLVETLLTIDNLPEKVKEMILRKSEGNPFFIEEVIRYLIDRNLIYHEGNSWKAMKEIEAIDVPDTIQSVLLSRVDRLEAEAKYVLQCASVIGRLFRYRLLEHLSQRERDLEKYLDQLEERELVYKERSVPELEYTFRHALTQEATYQGILERRRKEFHRRIADGIENLYRERIKEFYEELAHHYRLGGNDEKALEYLLKSGIKSVGRTLAQLGLEPEKYKAFYDVFHQMSGLTLVVGPIGSGKTTTLTAALDEINTPGVKLLGAFAVEDEIITDAIRASFNVDIGHTPAKMLRTVMLYDPDVIFVSDLPDKETVDIAIEAALMGHLVLSTLQAEDATDSLTHLLSIGVEPSRLANAIGAILAQRLVRKLCPQCKKALEPSEELRRTFAECQIEVPDKVYSAVGCDACEDGYKGRTAIHQVLVPNAEVRELIAQQASIEEIRSAARKGGMKTFLEDGMAKVALGIISAEEVFASLSGYFVNRHQVVSNNLVGRQ